jgi:hypothetical protein
LAVSERWMRDVVDDRDIISDWRGREGRTPSIWVACNENVSCARSTKVPVCRRVQ